MMYFIKTFKLFLIFFLFAGFAFGQMVPQRIHYGGGGDWYGNKTTWTNILRRVRSAVGLDVGRREVAHRILDPEFQQYPIAYLAGHGNVFFTEKEAAEMRRYLISGGFLFADDDYGMDKSFRREMKKVFPELKFVELPFSHPIYHIFYEFKNGLPKVHEHAGGPPHGLGLMYRGRLVCFYSFNTDISDGCEDEEIFHDPAPVREHALKMAVNIFLYAVLN